MSARRTVCCLACLVTAGCAHWDLGDPAPGVVDVSTPPPIVGQRHVVGAEHAGEKMLMINSGIFGSTGLRARQAGLSPWSTWGGEISVHWGEDPSNHSDHLPALPLPNPPWPTLVGPRNSWALTVGGSPRSLTRSASVPNGGDLYFEVQRMREFTGLAAGPVWNRTAGRVGGQVTAFLGAFYLRAAVLDRNAALQIGLAVKFPLTWVWPR